MGTWSERSGLGQNGAVDKVRFWKPEPAYEFENLESMTNMDCFGTSYEKNFLESDFGNSSKMTQATSVS